MKNKESIQKANQSTVNLNTYTPDALENTLHSLDLIHSNKKNIDYSKYKYTLIPVLSNSIKHNNIDTEAKKDISYRNKEYIRRATFYKNLVLRILNYSAISFVFGLAISVPLFIYIKTGGLINPELYLILKSIGSILLLSPFVTVALSFFILYFTEFYTTTFKYNIKNNKKIKEVNENIKEKVISEINKINNPQLIEMKESFKNYILSDNLSLKQKILRKIMFLKIKKSFFSSIVSECEEGINSKIIKEKQDNDTTGVVYGK